MTQDKGCFIKEIRENQAVEGLFLIKEASRAETRTGSPFLILTVMDTSGEMAGRVWDDADRWLPACTVGGIVRLTGQAQPFKGVLQLKVATVTAVPEDEVDLAQFVPAAPGNLQAMAGEVLKIAKGVEDPYLRELLLAFFQDRKFFTAFKRAPAAKNMHHAYLGGLLEHSLGVARLAAKVAELYPDVDSSLLLAGALLHDVGKVEEFSYAAYPFNYTDSGRLVGHHVLGVELVQARVARIPRFPGELALRLKHLILSHHGRHEFGSPAVPMMLEAFILNFLDDLDAKINYLRRLGDQAPAAGYQWTDYQRTLERFLYVQGQPGTGPDEEEAEIDRRQQNLWQR